MYGGCIVLALAGDKSLAEIAASNDIGTERDRHLLYCSMSNFF